MFPYDGFWFAFGVGAAAATAVLVFIPAAYSWVSTKIKGWVN